MLSADVPVTFSVIIPTHNRADALAQTLSHLAKQTFNRAWEVIVINNRCTDETDEVVRRLNFPVALRLVHEEVPGPAAARNAGALVAKGTYLLFIDNDILAEPDFLQRHYEALESHPGCWIVGQIINLPEQEATPFGRFRKSLSPFAEPNEGRSAIDLITGANTSLPRADFEQLGGFDSGFFVASGEDRELAMRALQAGIKILFDPSIIVLHNDWAGFSIRDYCLRQRLYCQTEPLFWRKYGESYPGLAFVRENLPPDWKRDHWKLIVWKRTKQLLGSPIGQSVLINLSTLVERVGAWSPLLWRVYKLALAGAIYRGVQDGLMMEREH